MSIKSRKNGDHRRRKAILKGFRRSTGVGAMPGTIDPELPSGQYQIRRITYSREDVQEEQFSDISHLVHDPSSDKVTWIQILGRPDSAALGQLSSIFGIHSLALEDISNSHQRCKVEDYGDHLFVVARLPRYLDDDNLSTEQVNIFFGAHYVISVYDGQPIFDTVRDRLIRSRTRVRDMPADYLAYAILDMVTDHYFPVIERIGNRLNIVDEQIEVHASLQHRAEIRSLRSDLLLLRRTIWPQRDALASLMRDDTQLIAATTKTYLRDCYDHTVQIMDVTETYRELCADLRDFHLSEISFRSNEVMKTLTIIATLFMPLSFIAGFYGMNFHHMPELAWRYSYPIAVGFMVAVAGSLLYWFWRKGWL